MSDEIFDITIIGGGPAGLFGSFYAGLRHAKCKVIEASDKLGGALVHEYPDEVLHDVAGYRLITAKAMAQRLIEQAEIYNYPMLTGERLQDMDHDEEKNIWILKTDKDTHYSKTVVIGIGTLEKTIKNSKELAKLFKKLVIKTDSRGIVVSENMETNLPGLFACGDIISKPEDQRRITSANSESAIAVNNAKKYIDPAAGTFPGHSTDLRKEK